MVCQLVQMPRITPESSENVHLNPNLVLKSSLRVPGFSLPVCHQSRHPHSSIPENVLPPFSQNPKNYNSLHCSLAPSFLCQISYGSRHIARPPPNTPIIISFSSILKSENARILFRDQVQSNRILIFFNVLISFPSLFQPHVLVSSLRTWIKLRYPCFFLPENVWFTGAQEHKECSCSPTFNNR